MCGAASVLSLHNTIGKYFNIAKHFDFVFWFFFSSEIEPLLHKCCMRSGLNPKLQLIFARLSSSAILNHNLEQVQIDKKNIHNKGNLLIGHHLRLSLTVYQSYFVLWRGLILIEESIKHTAIFQTMPWMNASEDRPKTHIVMFLSNEKYYWASRSNNIKMNTLENHLFSA